MRLIVDTFAYCAKEIPNWNTISISGYHIREAGSTAAQEVAFTLANGIAYVEAALAGAAHDHVGLADGQSIHVGNIELRAMHTPGHRPEHIALEVIDDP